MRYVKLNGLIAEIIQSNRPQEMVAFLEETLQVPPDKAEELVARIKKQCLNSNNAAESTFTNLFEKPVVPETPPKPLRYSVDQLSEREFTRFILWLLEDLGYKVPPTQSEAPRKFGVNIVAVKGEEKILFLARKYPRSKVTDAIILLAEKTKTTQGCSRAIVLATASFTQQAVAAAEKLGVELWDEETLDTKITQAKKQAEEYVETPFPPFDGSLLQSLMRLGETKDFLIESRVGEKYDLYLLGVKYPLLTFQTETGLVTKCIYRIKYNEPVTEFDGETLSFITDDQTVNAQAEANAYKSIIEYLQLFLD